MRPQGRGFFRKLDLAHGLLAAAYLLSLFGFYLSVRSAESATLRSLGLSSYSRAVRAAALSCRHFLRLSLAHGSLQEIETARRNAAQRLAESRAVARDQISPEEAAELGRLSRFVSAAGRLIQKIDRLQRDGRADQAAALYESGLRPLVGRYIAASLDERLREEAAARLEGENRRRLWSAAPLVFVILLSGLTFLVFLVWMRQLVGYASRNLARIQRALTAIRSGDFKVNIEPERADELGVICTSLKSLAVRLDLAQRRQDSFSGLADEAARSLNEVLCTVSGYLVHAREKSAMDAADAAALELILESAGRCNLLLAQLCERVAGQKILTDDAPDIAQALNIIESALGSGQEASR